MADGVRIDWVMQEAGWYTSDLGGICLWLDGWNFFPIGSEEKIGPFKTLKLAKIGAARAERERLEAQK